MKDEGSEEAKKAALAAQKKETDARIKETKEAKENTFIETTVNQYAMQPESQDQHAVLTKDKAYLAAGEVLEHRKVRGI